MTDTIFAYRAGQQAQGESGADPTGSGQAPAYGHVLPGRAGGSAGPCPFLHTQRMGTDTFSYEPPERQPLPMTYWRRRFLALVAGLAVLALVAWAFSGALGASGGGSLAARAGHGPHGHGTHGYGSGPGAAPEGAASRASWSGGGSSSGSGGASGSGAVPHASHAPPPAPSSARPASTGRARAARSAPPACPAGDLVLSVFSSQDSYGRGQLPEFDVDVVSTSARTCAFNVGPRFLALVITTGGKRIWSSADCVAGPGSLLTDLARGVPTVLPLSWDRETSAPGCSVTSQRVPNGSFAAAAAAGGVTSNSVKFTLG